MLFLPFTICIFCQSNTHHCRDKAHNINLLHSLRSLFKRNITHIKISVFCDVIPCSFLRVSRRLTRIWCLYDRASLLKQYKQQTRCKNNGLLFQSAQHVSGDNFAHPQEHYSVFTACGRIHRWGYQQAASSVYYTTSCKHSLVILRMGEIIARNMLSSLELLINRYCCI